ncbi:MAG: metal-dependent hydrolase [Acidobacteria bacterium]|nr:MAG: metal-dependent hydrolase [Acidobacteriota bacterium]REK08432.1 MAG: metal-dependent hydrolase [Acidobacteriota bacterium]
MSAKLTFLGHSGFLIDDGATTLAIDPFLTGNPKATMSAEEVRCQFIALTHGHADHMGDALAIARRNDANVIAAFEICNYFEEKGHGNVNPGNPGGRIDTEFGWVALTQAFHSSSFEGRYMGMPCGVVAHIGDKTIYHLGDTTIFRDLELIGEIYRPDLVLVPIGDRFTMGPELATRAAEMIGAPRAVPIHYDTWAPIEQDPAQFAPQGVEVEVMQPGDTLQLD